MSVCAYVRVHARFASGYSSKATTQNSRYLCERIQAEIYIIIRDHLVTMATCDFLTEREKKNVHRCAVFQPRCSQTLLLQASRALSPCS